MLVNLLYILIGIIVFIWFIQQTYQEYNSLENAANEVAKYKNRVVRRSRKDKGDRRDGEFFFAHRINIFRDLL